MRWPWTVAMAPRARSLCIILRVGGEIALRMAGQSKSELVDYGGRALVCRCVRDDPTQHHHLTPGDESVSVSKILSTRTVDTTRTTGQIIRCTIESDSRDKKYTLQTAK